MNTTLRRSGPAFIALGVLVIGVVVYRRITSSQQSAAGDCEAKSLPQTVVDPLAELQAEHDSLVTAARAAAERSSPPAPERGVVTSATRSLEETGDDWPGPYKRSRLDLPPYFTVGGGRVRHNQLVRHVELNKHDISIPPDRIAELDRLLQHYNAVLEPIVQNYHATRSREMIRAIEINAVEPTEFEPIDRSIAESRARRVSEATGESHETALTMVRQRPPPGQSYIRHGGKVYLHKSFPDLPVSESMHKALQYFGTEFLAHVVKWFEGYGYLSPGDASAILARCFADNPTRRK